MASAQAACGPPRAGWVVAVLAGMRAGTVPGAGSVRWLLPGAALSDCAFVLVVATAGWLALGAELGGFAAANVALRAAAEAAACAAEAADTGALAANTGAEATDVAADAAPLAADAASTEPLAAALALDAAAEAVVAGVEAIMVSDPGPVSGTGNGRIVTALAPSLEPIKGRISVLKFNATSKLF